LATLLLVRHLPTVVTVHDIIPYLLRGDKVLGTYQHAFDRLFDLLAMRALGRARRLIASSAFTRRTIIDSLGIPGHRIDVVHLSVNRDLFRPLSRPSQVRETYGLEPQQPLVIFVGSEDPRKNLATLIGAFALVRRRLPHAALLKIGAAHFLDQRQRLLRLVHELGLGGSVRFLDHVPDKDLPLWYNAADVFVLPSLYEGFGYPALEAMSCGTPVIAANRASLPEVVGQGGTLVDPQDEQQMAREITRLLVDPERRAAASEAALAQAARFSPQRQADQTIAVYEQIA
jgi:glycosyltransferase involved in cell wall biosynthesis